MEFILGVLESLTAAAMLSALSIGALRFASPHAKTFRALSAGGPQGWYAAWMPFGDDDNEWVTEVLDVRFSWIWKSFSITSRAVKSSDGMPVRSDETVTPAYHWCAKGTITPDGAAIVGNWHSLLQPQRYKGQFWLVLHRLTILVGTCQASTPQMTNWSGTMILCRTIPEIESVLRRFVSDQRQVQKMIGNLERLKL